MPKSCYSEKLKDPRWQKKRLEILERDGWKCKFCGDKYKTLHVHHLFYLPKTDPWDVPSGFLLTLCENCHLNTPDEDYLPTIVTLEMLSVLLDTYWKCGYSVGDLTSLSYEISKNKIPAGKQLNGFDLTSYFMDWEG